MSDSNSAEHRGWLKVSSNVKKGQQCPCGCGSKLFCRRSRRTGDGQWQVQWLKSHSCGSTYKTMVDRSLLRKPRESESGVSKGDRHKLRGRDTV